jgi:hypothetical protein
MEKTPSSQMQVLVGIAILVPSGRAERAEQREMAAALELIYMAVAVEVIQVMVRLIQADPAIFLCHF